MNCIFLLKIICIMKIVTSVPIMLLGGKAKTELVEGL
ncbi:hypothetical protein bsdtw1_00349 [Clostridium fungisolvens]|uniref:Uncharacterized protein n=1 Tax=Clostridium fungisolvens TaxID=1604897 RepID=A0A6V8SHD9_9CLOT|nr:hypothetical protein bsdtw1_00349 [Clostridium fungisolvens]